MDASTDTLLREMVDRIVRGFDPEQILLFGSRARGDERPDSDYDLLVVMSSCADRRRSAVALRSALADLPAGKDIVVATPAEMSGRETDSGSAIVRSAVKEGRVVYERHRSPR